MKRIIFVILLFAAPAWAQPSPIETRFVSATPVADTQVYATGELIGGKLTFTNALSSRTKTGIIISAAISDKASQAQDLELWLFDADPTNTTFTDQAAFDPDDADLSKVTAIINFGSSSRFAVSDNGMKYVGSLALPVRGGSSAAPSTTIYGALISRGTPTFASASDLAVKLAIVSD